MSDVVHSRQGQSKGCFVIFSVKIMSNLHVKKPQSLYFWCFGEIPFSVQLFLMDFNHIFLLQKWKNVVIMSVASD